MVSKTNRFYNIVALAVTLLLVIPVGFASIYLGVFHGENPCIMCWQERTVMMFIGVTSLLIMRYGLRPKYLALMILYCTIGIFFTLRHTGTHFLMDIGQGFASDLFGIHTYTWGIIIYWFALFTLSIVLGFFTNNIVDNEDGDIRYLSKLQNFSFIVFFIVMIINGLQAFSQVGPPPFIGQHEPVRFSWNPRHWDWSTRDWAGILRPFSLRGQFSIDKPDLSSRIRRDIAMFESGDELVKVQAIALPDGIVGDITDIDYNFVSKRFAVVTDQFYVYILDGKLSEIVSYVKVDSSYRIDIKTFVGVAFMSPSQLIVTGFNKSYSILSLNPQAKLESQYENFHTGTNGIVEKKRGLFSTVRAKYSYVRSVTWDPKNKEIITLSVPSSKNRKVVTSRFSNHDYLLNSEVEVFTNGNISTPTITSLKIFQGTFFGLNPFSNEILISTNSMSGFTGSIKLPSNGDYKGLAVFDNDQFVLIDGKIAVFYMK